MAATKGPVNVLARIAQYKPPLQGTLVERICHFLDWAAVNCKMQYFQHNIVCKVVNNYQHTPRMDNKEVDTVRSAMYRVKKTLRKKYQRELHFKPGMGVRATVDDNDKVQYGLTTAAKGLINKKKNLDEVASIINPSNLNMKESEYFRHVTAASKLITETHIARLLPPKKED